MQLGEIVRRATRGGEQLEGLRRLFGVRRSGGGGQLFGDRLFRSAEVDARSALTARNAVDGGAGDQIAIERDGAAGVVIGRNRESDAVGIAIGVEDRGDRDVEAVRLLDRELFLVGVDHEDQVRQAAHVLDAAQRLLELVALARQHEALLLGQARGARGELLVDLAETVDGAGNRLPVGQHAAEPAGVDVILGRALGGVGDLLLRLALGADEQHATALGDRIGHDLQRLMEQRHRLGEVDDVDVVADAEDVLVHLRVPAMRLVAEMRAGLEQATHGNVRKRHDSSFSGWTSAGLRGRKSGHRTRFLQSGTANARLWDGAPIPEDGLRRKPQRARRPQSPL